MSSKFFTWTKGDRRNASEALRSGGVVPIPAECLTIKGMDYARSAKGRNRKPLPLPLDQQAYATPSRISRTSDSIALHDAAVQSATSLMAVMNDMLRSPQLSAHISSRRESDLMPMYARPRSHTAPPTPLVEAGVREPAELPGSLPIDQLSLASGIKNSSDTALVRPHDSVGFGVSVPQPYSSPQENKCATRCEAFTPTRDVRKGTELHPVNAPGTPRSQGTDHLQTCYNSRSSTDVELQRPTLINNDATNKASSERPKLSVVHPRRPVSPSFIGSAASSHRGSSTIVPRVEDAPEDTESMLLEEIARIRASQEEHVCSLKEAHEKELGCQRSYISFLEKRRTPTVRSSLQQEQLTIDTSQSGSKTELDSEPSATTTKSFESYLSNSKRASQDAVAEADALRRKLILCKKAQVDAEEVRRERDQLRDVADRSNRRILQLKDIVRKAKENERTLRNQGTDLEARLVDANTQRIDALEGFHDACTQVSTANERERRLAQELDELRARELPSAAFATLPHCQNPKPARAKHVRAVSDAGSLATTPPRMDPTMRQLIESRRMLAAKDERITKLKLAVTHAQEQDSQHQACEKQIADLERRVDQQREQLSAAQVDAKRYNSLLHNELRRQARNAAQHADKTPPQTEAEAFVVASEKMVRLRSRAVTSSDVTSAPLPLDTSAATLAATLEKELDHCIGEVILYKLDIKGYRKDLKKANAELDELRSMGMRRPPTPDRDSLSSTRSQRSENSVRATNADEADARAPASRSYDPGLGLSLPQPPKTPTEQISIAAATTTALSSPLANPPCAKTRLNTDKKLPKPPVASRTPSPLPSASRSKWPEQDIARTQTLRSLSESIISSYAKRSQVDLETTPLDNGPDRWRILASPGTPAPTAQKYVSHDGACVV